MSLSSSNLDAFLAVTQTLNFTKAADKLNITQSALSQRILNLESELGATLFIRDRSGVKVTELGLSLIRYCQIKNSLEADFLSGLIANNQKELAGIVRIGGFSSVMSSIVLESLAPILQCHHKVKIHIVTKELGELIDLLKRGEIDYMISDNRISKEELECVPLGVEKNVLVESKNYESSEKYIDHDEDDEMTINYLRKFKIPSKSIERIFLDDIHGLIAGVRLGLGRAVLPIHLLEELKDLRILNPKQTLDIPVNLYFYHQAFYSKLHSQIVDALLKGFKKKL